MAKSKVATILVIAVSVLVGGAAYALRAKQAAPGGVVVDLEALPMAFEGYTGREERFSEGIYEVLQADTSTMRVYVDQQSTPIYAFIAYFGEQNYGEQIHSPRNCLPGGGWRIVSLDRVPVEVAGQGMITSNRLLIDLDGKRQIMYYFFITRVGTVASEYKLKFELARAALTFQPRDAVFVRVSVPVGADGPGPADQRALQFLTDAMPLLSRGLPF